MTDLEQYDRADGNLIIFILILKKHACHQFIQLCLKQVLWGIALNSDALHLWNHFSAAYLSQSTFFPFDYRE